MTNNTSSDVVITHSVLNESILIHHRVKMGLQRFPFNTQHRSAYHTHLTYLHWHADSVAHHGICFHGPVAVTVRKTVVDFPSEISWCPFFPSHIEFASAMDKVVYLVSLVGFTRVAVFDALYRDRTTCEKCYFLLFVVVANQSSCQHLQPYILWSGISCKKNIDVMHAIYWLYIWLYPCKIYSNNVELISLRRVNRKDDKWNSYVCVPSQQLGVWSVDPPRKASA